VATLPPPAPAPAPVRRGGGKVATVIAMVVLLLAGGMAVALSKHSSSGSDSSGGPAANQSSPPAHALHQKWQAELPKSHVRGNLSGLPALWTTDRGPVYADDNGVRAFDPETGKKLWTVKTPKGASEVCAIAPQPNSDGVGAAVYDAGGNDCAFLVVFDTETGKTLWSKNLSSGYKTVAPHVEVSEDTVVTGIGGVAAYSISHKGTKVWTLYSRGRDCGNDIDWSSGYLAASSSCSDAKPENQLSIHDLRYGDVWKFPNEKRDVEQVLGDDPLTLVLAEQEGNDDPKRTLQTYTKDGKPDKAFPLTGALKDLQFGATTTDRDSSVLLSYYDTTSGMAATDLKTGKVLWSKRQTRQVGMEDGKVIALRAPKMPAQDPTLVSLGLRDGAEESRGVLYTPKHSLQLMDAMSAGAWDDTLYVIGSPLDDPQGKLVLRAFDIGR
uniref:outer membrane protein assembly factor BamB family protein n=1 Tax=Streptomyces milbemycinicus TaxID=476552 RepID=UPI001B803CF5